MVHPCVVKGCKNKSKDGIFRFPRDEMAKSIWLQNLALAPEEVNDLTRVCGRHFKQSDFQRDLKGELLGIPSKRKLLVDDAVPSLDQPAPSSQKANDYPTVRKFRHIIKRPVLPRTKTEYKMFVKRKEALLKEIKLEAALKVEKDKLLKERVPTTLTVGCNEDRPTVMPPQQCVILQPVPAEEVLAEEEGQRPVPVPVIIPGDPREAMKMLQDKKVQELIESQVASTENVYSEDPSRPSAILVPSLTEPQVKIEPRPWKRTGYAPIRIKESFSTRQETIDHEVDPSHILNTMNPGESKRCTVLDLLFEKNADLNEGASDSVLSHPIPLPEPVPGDSNLSVIVFKEKTRSEKLHHPEGVLIFDPDGLKKELDKWKNETKNLRKVCYDLKMKNQVLRNEKKKFEKKILIRDKLLESKKAKAKKDADLVTNLKQEISSLRQIKNKMRRREYNRRAKHEKVLERRRRRRDYIMQQIELGNMDKSSLSLIYSRKKLPCDNVSVEANGLARNVADEVLKRLEPVPQVVEEQTVETELPQGGFVTLPSTATVEYIIEHDETAVAVAGIPNRANTITYHVETADPGQIQDLEGKQGTTIISTTPEGTVMSGTGEYGQEQIDFIMKAVHELEGNGAKQ